MANHFHHPMSFITKFQVTCLQVSQELVSQDSVITSKHVYTILNTNRFGIKDFVMRIFNINKAGKVNQSADDNSFDLSNTETTNNITFLLIISNEIWKYTKPTKRT